MYQQNYKAYYKNLKPTPEVSEAHYLDYDAFFQISNRRQRNDLCKLNDSFGFSNLDEKFDLCSNGKENNIGKFTIENP